MPFCFFIGHRDAPESLLPKVRAAAEGLILREGVTDFYVGSRGSFDRLAAAAVRELMAEYPQVCCIGCWPICPGRGRGRRQDSRARSFPRAWKRCPGGSP